MPSVIKMRNVIAALVAVLAVASAALPTPDQYKVKGLEKYGAADEMYAGLMPVTWEANNEGSLFFWLATHRPKAGKPKAAGAPKLVVWLNGGPGCSSMIGMMHEHGPFTIEPAAQGAKNGLKYNLKRNPYSWSEVANVLYVEQPIRTGFSVAAEGAGPIKDETQVAADFRNFLISFLAVFTEYKGAEMFISGESYAGFYVPWIAEHIVQMQLVTNAQGVKVRDTSLDGLNLAGVAIGNGVMDMYFQEPSYAEYAYYHGLIPLGAKLKFERDWRSCMEMIESRGEAITRGSFDECNMMGRVLEAAGLPNEYNTATFIQYGPIIGPGSTFDSFFQDAEIQEILHVRGYDLPGLNFAPEAPAPAKPAPSRRLQPVSSMQSVQSLQQQSAVAGASDVSGVSAVPVAYSAVAAAADVNADASTGGTAGKSKGKFYAPPHGWGACNDDIDESMSADHPTSVVKNLQFLSQVSPIAVPPATASTPAAPSTSAAPTAPSKTPKGPKRHLTGAESAAPETNLRAAAVPVADSSTTATPEAASTDATVTGVAQSTGNWLFNWWTGAKNTASGLLPTSTGPVIEPGPVVPPGAVSKPVPAPAPAPAPAPPRAPAPVSVLHKPHTTSPTAPPVSTVPEVPVYPAAAPPSHAIRVLLYSGEFDLNCNTLGTLHTLEANRWRNKPWFMAERSLWKFGNDIAGEYLTMDEMFSFLIVRNSGHLLPKDLPAIALDLIDRFVNQRTFADQPLPSEQSYMIETADAGLDALHMESALHSTAAVPVLGVEPNVGTTSGVILAMVLIIAALRRVLQFGSKETAGAGAAAGFGGIALSTHSYTAIPSSE